MMIIKYAHFLTVNPARAAVTTHADSSPFTTSFGQSLTPIEPFRVRQHALQEADLIWPHSDINKVETSKKSDKKPKRLTFRPDFSLGLLLNST